MFTAEQIKQAHAQVKSGADFPNYVLALKKIGVDCYETFVTDGHTDFYGTNKYNTSLPARYSPLAIQEKLNTGQFKNDLAAHQQGKTDYPTFCRDAAESGIEKWVVCTTEMTCTYYSKTGSKVWEEQIPQ